MTRIHLALLVPVLTFAACDRGTGATKPQVISAAVGTYRLSLIEGAPLPRAHRETGCSALPLGTAFRGAAFDSVLSGELTLSYSSFENEWTVRTNEPKAGDPSIWKCYRSGLFATWKETSPGVIYFYRGPVGLMSEGTVTSETITATDPRFAAGTALEVTRFNGGLRGRFIKQ